MSKSRSQQIDEVIDSLVAKAKAGKPVKEAEGDDDSTEVVNAADVLASEEGAPEGEGETKAEEGKVQKKGSSYVLLDPEGGFVLCDDEKEAEAELKEAGEGALVLKVSGIMYVGEEEPSEEEKESPAEKKAEEEEASEEE